ncbi:hypothetical protein A6R68_21174 [Neotoma lepida]|uniref:PX domain-containing protein n=1 Tax=Neotoma lepida TaxID=56216 RepID=A0A1A6HQT4_NEOLE|nr:hypothetical protein A6R68_21174 [Neotoma lepida]
MAGPRHPVSAHAVALVQMERLQTFAFSVLWSDNSDSSVRRSWDEFRQLQKILKKTFPVEAGLLQKSERVLPKLPDAPLLTRRGHTGRGLVRLRLLDTYVQALLATSEHVLRSSALNDFFAPKLLDLEPTLPPGRADEKADLCVGEERGIPTLPTHFSRAAALPSLVILPTPEEPLSQPASNLAIHSLEAQSMRCWWLVENKDQQIAWFPAPYLEEVAPGQGQDSLTTKNGPCGKAETKPRREVIMGHQACGCCLQPGESSSGFQSSPGFLELSPEKARTPALQFYSDPQIPTLGTQFFATQAYEGSRTDELSVPAGARVYNGRVGLFPAVLLQPEGLGSLLGRPGLPDSKREDKVAKDMIALPVVPTRPCMSAIQRRCCTITRKALEQGTQGSL